MTSIRREYYPAEEIKKEILETVEQGITFDALTFSASGETTLHSRLGELIAFAKKQTEKPVVVITNGTTLENMEVRSELAGADIVMPSLDAATSDTFRRINRPCGNMRPDNIIDGMASFRQEFDGRLWLEILFVKGVNDSDRDIEALLHAVEAINPDRVQLNTVNRPPAEPWVDPLSEGEMTEICKRFGKKADVIADFHKKDKGNARLLLEKEIVETLRRRPISFEDIEEMMGADARFLKKLLNSMEHKGIIERVTVAGRTFFRIKSE
jgi:wyosine [tRNA(Phe)-imidazoG37] synthetase (radical SAM superfamily)